MKKSKLFTNLVLCLVVSICFSTSVYAASASAVLRVEDSSDCSDVIGLSKFANYYAANSPNSLFDVYCIVHRSFPGEKWKKVKESLMDQGSSSSGKKTEDKYANWKLELNPKGWGFIGCEAVGEISY